MKKATITQINKDTITALINQESMCAHCQINSNCTIKNCSKKEIIIKKDSNTNYKIGQTINISINNKSSFYAIAFAYIMPLIIMLSTFYTLTNFNYSQTKCGIFAIISLIPYYFLIFLLKDKIENKIKIKTNDN